LNILAFPNTRISWRVSSRLTDLARFCIRAFSCERIYPVYYPTVQRTIRIPPGCLLFVRASPGPLFSPVVIRRRSDLNWVIVNSFIHSLEFIIQTSLIPSLRSAVVLIYYERQVMINCLEYFAWK
jgi:hypothetical protein